MRILHTSDWHLGAQLHDHSRLPEQEKFLEWLKALMIKERPDALIIAGDIFDSCAPSNTAQNLYYDFLAATFKETLCRTVVVIGGNHDSPSLLDAPGNALAHLHARVVGAVAYAEAENGEKAPIFEKEVVVIPGVDGKPGLVVAAVPYLRDADLRTSEALETDSDRSEKLKRGFKEHYEAVAGLARQKAQLPDGGKLPLILTGHLFLAGATLAGDQSERAIQVGNLDSLEMALLPSADYYALGHLHSPQNVGGSETCRYSGAPIPMSFGESRQTKSVAIVDLSSGSTASIRLVEIPKTQRLEQLKGSPEVIAEKLKELVATRENIWVDIQVTEGDGDLSPCWSQYMAIAGGTDVRLLRRQNARPGKEGSALAVAFMDDTRLEDITPEKLFEMRLQDEALTEQEKSEYSIMFGEILRQFTEADTNKE